MKRNSFFAGILALAMLLGLMAGCGTPASSAEASVGASQEETAAPEETGTGVCRPRRGGSGLHRGNVCGGRAYGA